MTFNEKKTFFLQANRNEIMTDANCKSTENTKMNIRVDN